MVLVLAGCGGGDKGERRDVGVYIKAVNAIQAGAGQGLDRASRAYAGIAGGKLAPAVARRRALAAEDVLQGVRDRLAAQAAPRAAADLRRRLLGLYDLELGLARETTQLALYQPAASRALDRLGPAGRRLAGGLRARTPERQARAVQGYADALSRALGDLRRLSPPPVLTARHEAELQTLTSSRRLAQRLRRAIARRDTRRVARLLIAFRRQATAPDASRRLTLAALRGYRTRVAALDVAAARVRAASNALALRFPPGRSG